MKILLIIWFTLNLFTLYAPETDYIKNKQEQKFFKMKYIEHIETSTFTPERFYNALQFWCKEPGILYQQALLETGWFKSESFLVYNNPFGMKVPAVRATFVHSEGLGHAGYEHWTDAVKDMAKWQKYWYSLGYNMDDYYQFLLLVGYAEDPDYIIKLKTLPDRPNA